MTIYTRLSDERLQEIMEIRKEQNIDSTVKVLESNELNSYMVNVNEALERQVKNMAKYKGKNNGMYSIFESGHAKLLEVKAELIDRMESEALKEMGTFEIKVEKREKLSPAQKKVMDKINNAVYGYTTKYHGHLNRDWDFITNDIIINGEGYGFKYEQNQNGTWYKRVDNKAYICGNNTFAIELSTNTINALVKKGYIHTPEKINGDGMDFLTPVDTYEVDAPFTHLQKVTATHTAFNSFVGKELTHTTVFYTLEGQEHSTMEHPTFEGYVLQSIETVEVNVHNFNK